jgi:hypothetical protein
LKEKKGAKRKNSMDVDEEDMEDIMMEEGSP